MNRLFGSNRQKRKYKLQAEQLLKLGFTEKQKSLKLLELYAGDVNLVLEEYYDSNRHLAELLKENGNKFMKQKKYTKAADSYTKSIHLNPNNAIYYANRAAAYIYLGKYTDAIRDSHISMHIDANYVKSYIRAGLAYFKIGNYQKAKDAYCKALTKINICETNNYAFCLKKMKLCQNKINAIS